jgi:hypothetical protein
MASRTTRDLPARLNSTPVVDLGVVMGREHERMLVAARFIHISNGGIVNKGEKNKGQNQLYLLVQVPF